ncbi:phosphopyruvate hydratase [Candidatus Microgenomates bacterium]|nr:phosphopyruvate hydratase [Candidatus Microgenomates bacterium]
MKITSLRAIEIIDSRGKPTIRSFAVLDDGSIHSASVPSGASTGSHEVLELRDYDPKRYQGFGVQKAVHNVNEIIAKELVGREVDDPRGIDRWLIERDGTENKSNLGANAILAVSMAVVRAAAHAVHKPQWKYLNEYYFSEYKPAFPRLMVNIVNGGRHADWNFDIQEFMICPVATKPSESIQIASEIFLRLGDNLKSKKIGGLVGDEGGYSPTLKSNEEVFDTILESAVTCGYEKLKDFFFAVDCAASEFYENGEYTLKKTGQKMNATQLTQYYSELGQKYNIQSFEDPFAEDDWEAFTRFTQLARQFQFQVVGDDLFCTNPNRIKAGIEKQAANAVLIKLNQIGTVSETVDAIKMTREAGWKVIISHRSGETENPFIADLAYGCGAEFIKTGSMSRSERLAKYNRLLEIESGIR